MTGIDGGYAYARAVRHSQRPAPSLTPEPAPWMLDAACLQYPAEMWHVDKGSSNREAKTVCKDCPVRADCLAFAMVVEVDTYRFGIYGGLSPTERHALTDTGWQPGDPTPDVHIAAHGAIVVCPDCGKGTRALAAHRAKAHRTVQPRKQPRNYRHHDVQPCGTSAACRRHYRRGEPIDEACRAAQQRANAERRARGIRGAA